MIKEDATAFVLAGGKSLRMGRDKGLVEFEGKPLIGHVLSQLTPIVNSVVIISNQDAYHNLGYKVIEDEVKSIGPAGGIYTALKNSETKMNFVTACDMPFITAESVRFMLKSLGDFDICIPINQGMLEPLFGVYSKNCLEIWEQNILKGNYKLQDLINQFRVNRLAVETNPLLTQKLFTNINSEKDLNPQSALENTKSLNIIGIKKKKVV